MHEMGIIENIFKKIEQVAQENNLRKINKVRLKIGKMRQVVPEMLEFAFEAVAKGSMAEGAQLEVKYLTITMKCDGCKKEFVVEENVYICPHCEKTRLTNLSGKEVLLDSIEGDK